LYQQDADIPGKPTLEKPTDPTLEKPKRNNPGSLNKPACENQRIPSRQKIKKPLEKVALL
jgi:hypothetical protein